MATMDLETGQSEDGAVQVSVRLVASDPNGLKRFKVTATNAAQWPVSTVQVRTEVITPGASTSRLRLPHHYLVNNGAVMMPNDSVSFYFESREVQFDITATASYTSHRPPTPPRRRGGPRRG